MDDVVQERLLAGSKRIEVRKGDILLRAGDTKERSFFVVKGCIRSYVIDSNGKEHVLQFAPEGWFVGDMKSAVRKVPASIFIDALEPSTLIEVDAERMQHRMANDIAVQTVMFLKLHKRVITLQDRIIDLLASTGEERYLRFIATYPGLMQRLPQKLIASYLGVTPESLSRIRRSIAGQGAHE